MKRLQADNAQWLQHKAYIIQGILHREYQRMVTCDSRRSCPYVGYEAIRNLEQWIMDHGNRWTYTCGECAICDEIYCTRRPLTMQKVISTVITIKRLAEEQVIHIPESFYK